MQLRVKLDDTFSWNEHVELICNNRHLKITRFSRTGTASAILNSLNDDVIASSRKSYAFSRGNQWSTRKSTPGKNG